MALRRGNKIAPPYRAGGEEEEEVLEVVIYTEGLPFDGRTPFERSLGGSESAVVFMARALARRGHGVEVFCRCPRPGEYEGVRYRDLTDWPEFLALGSCRESKIRPDVFVCCRHLRGLVGPVNSRINVVWNHDILVKQSAQHLMSLMFKVDRLFVLSEFHKGQFQRHLAAPEDRYVVTRNGVDLELVDEAIAGVERDPNRVLYTSRPERGLDVLLTMWPEMKRACPQLRLAIAHYENPGADAQMAEYLATLRRVAEALPDVTPLGPLCKRELYRELAGSALLVYPATFPEVSCISALEAAACGTPVVASRYCGLKESVVDGETGALIPGNPQGDAYQQAFVSAVAELIGDEARRESLGSTARRRVEKRYQWRTIAEEWEREFEGLMVGGKSQEQAPAQHDRRQVAGPARGGPRHSCSATGRDAGWKPFDCAQDRPALPGGRQSVSVCMIVKDGQGTLYRCLESVKPVADEIIVCDTGSTDRTMEIAREYTDQVYSVPWEEDFAAARNRSIEQAKGDWILWIDADEHLVGAEHLPKYLRDNMYNGYVIRQHHHAVDAQFKPDVPVRLFRNGMGIRFFGCVHEHPETEMNRGVQPAVILADVHIVHDGYVTEAIRRQRFVRNLPLLMKDRQWHPERRLGLVFLERDYVHLARYELERTRGMMTEKAQQYLERATAIHQECFRSPDDPLHGYSLPLYQQALELLGVGFEVGYWLEVGEGAGASSCPTRHSRRFLDEAEAREFLGWHFGELMREAKGEEEFGFEEAAGMRDIPALQGARS